MLGPRKENDMQKCEVCGNEYEFDSTARNPHWLG